MKFLLFLAAVLCSLSVHAVSQTATPTPEISLDNEIIGGQPPPNDQPAPPKSQDDKYVRPSAKARFKRYAGNLGGPYALGAQFAKAGLATWSNSPEEWGDKWEGFGRRVASNLGKNVIEETAKYGLDEAFKLDSHFYRSKKRDTGSKLRNALLSPVTARNRNGKRVFGLPRIAGIYGSHIIATEAWFPARYNYKDGLKSGTVSLGLNAAFNVFKEFILKK
ncbi:MAG: hypothetical protein H7070_01745 [Saprospiraceae bacterium]|nr:hypothetical protein [Pyrinomonadaceae bacterium]